MILTIFAEAASLTVFIMCCVSQLKQFNVKDPWLTRSAYAVGLLFGGAYRLFQYNPSAAIDWFWLVVFGMVCGFVATGIYKTGESMTGGKEIKEDIKARAMLPDCPDESDYFEGVPPGVRP